MRTVLLTSLAVLALAACGPKGEAKAPAAQTAAAETAAEAGGLTLGADKLPRFRPGVWEVTQIEDGETEVTRHCVGEEARDDLKEMLTRETPECQTQRAFAPGGIKLNAVCTQAGGLKTETALVMTGNQTAYDMKLGLYVVTPDGKREGGETVVKAKFTGQACPAGVKPGEDIE